MAKTFGKKAQLDTFIVGFLVFLLLTVVVGAFMIFSISLSKIKNSREIIGTGSFGSSNPLLQQVEFSIDGEKQKMLLADALIFLNRNGVDHVNAPKFEGLLKQIVNAEKPCLAFVYSDSAKPSKRLRGALDMDGAPSNYIKVFLQYENGEAVSSSFLEKIILRYSENKMFHSTSITLPSGKGSSNIYVDYYYGPCLEDENA
ncbi:MAG: hypothetical protein AABX07_06290 [Nanoarchaeota archaeon]